MKYESSELLDRLAAEHALGTLHAGARRRFERLCRTSAAARTALDRWEDDWCALSLALEPVQPSARVWEQVSRQVHASRGSAPARRPRRRAWQLAAAASLVALALALGWIVREQYAAPQTLAVLGTDSAHPLWRIERRAELSALTIRVIGPVQTEPGRAYELWALPRGGRAPVSLGLLPAGGTLERTLSAAQRAALLAADKVAVSVEPATGSPTGSPTGPVVIVVSLPALG
jgi:anti-sigma-K factor RskA